MKKTRNQIRNKDIVRSRAVHVSAAPRMEPKVKIVRVRSRGKPTQIRKPRKRKK